MSENKKKILFIAPSPLYVEKGSSLRMYAILEILSKHYQIDLVTYSTGRDFALENVKVHRTSHFYKPDLAVGTPSFAKIFLDALMYLKIVKLSLLNKYDIVHCEDFEGIALGYFSAWFNKKSVFVYDLHNRILDNLHLKNKAKQWRDNIILFLEKKFVQKSDKIILNWAKYQNDPLLSTKPHFLYYDPIDTTLDEVVKTDENYLIYSGNFEEYQGLSDFIPVFVKSNTPYRLYLVGKPSEKVLNLIKELDCADKVKVLGRKSIQETNALIKEAVAGILPRREGSCMKAIHYILWGKPVIAKDTASNREMVRHEENGFLYNSNLELENILKITIDPESIMKLHPGINGTKNKILKIWNHEIFLKHYEN